MKILPGSRWKSAVCDTEVVVVKAPKEEAELQCGGATMLPHNAPKPADAVCAAGQDGGSLLGKRYGDDAAAIEVLCTKAGQGGLAIDGRAMVIRQTVQLPSSD